MILSLWGMARAKETDTQQCQELIVAKKCEDARKLCTGWLDSADIVRQAEGRIEYLLKAVELAPDECAT
jgi:hypothetical protein